MFKIKSAESISGHTQAIYALCKISEHQFISAGGDGFIVQWDINHPEKGVAVAKTPEIIFSAAYHQNTNSLICGTMTGGIYWLNLSNGTVLKNVLHHVGGTYDVFCQNDTVFTCGADGIITGWNAYTGVKEESIKCSLYGIRCMFFLDNSFFYAGDQAGYLISGRYYSGAAKNAIPKENQNSLTYLKAHDQTIFSMYIDSQNERIYTGGRDAKLNCYEQHSLELSKSLDAHWFTVNKLKELGGLNTLATASRDKTIRLWNLHSLELLHTIRRVDGIGHTHSVNNLLWFASQNLLISCSDDRQIMMYSIQQTGNDIKR